MNELSDNPNCLIYRSNKAPYCDKCYNCVNNSDFKLPTGVKVVDLSKPTPEQRMLVLMVEFLNSFDLNGWLCEEYMPSDIRKKYVKKFLEFKK